MVASGPILRAIENRGAIYYATLDFGIGLDFACHEGFSQGLCGAYCREFDISQVPDQRLKLSLLLLAFWTWEWLKSGESE